MVGIDREVWNNMRFDIDTENTHNIIYIATKWKHILFELSGEGHK